MSWFNLKKAMGTNYLVDSGDIVNTKKALSQLGYYDAPPHRGIDDWTDDAMFNGIRAFQQDKGLKVDGFMRPGGPTEMAINANLAEGDAQGDQLAFGGSLPNIILKRTPKGGGNGGGSCYPDRGPGSNEDCDRLADLDEAECRKLPLPRLRQPCWESANQRNAACKAGRTMPPLNTNGW
ncbi:MAG TPA: peptidoglycan-binding domain-containing protein [Magnetospirillum sp.]|nr:peptidoglycan-binding domain-containing protein [Magnetospirillum sp.]